MDSRNYHYSSEILYILFVGVDYIGDSMLLTLNPEDASIQVPITIISDNRLEGNEIFLGSLSTPNNPPSGLGPSMVSTATITIIDDVCTLVINSEAHAQNNNTYYIDSTACKHACARTHAHTRLYYTIHELVYTHLVTRMNTA